MKTNTNAYRALIRNHIVNGLYDYEGPDTEADRARHIFEKFTREYDYIDNRKRTPNHQARVAEWLSGLPLNIAYSNFDICQLYEAWHGESLSDAKAEKIISNWFNHCAFHLLTMWESHGLKVQ